MVGRRSETLNGAIRFLLVLLALSLPFEVRRPVLSFEPYFVFTDLEMLVVLSGVLWGIQVIWARKLPELRTDLSTPVLFLFISFLISSLLAPEFRYSCFKFTSRLLMGVFVFFLTVHFIDSERRCLVVLKAVLVSALLASILGLFEWVYPEGAGPLLSHFRGGVSTVGGILRVGSSFEYPTIASMFLEMAFLLVAGGAFTGRGATARIWTYAAQALILWTIILTMTRAGLLSIVGALFLVGGLNLFKEGWGRAAERVGPPAALCIALIALASAVNPVFNLRLKTESDSSWYGVQYETGPTLTLAPGQISVVQVKVTNTGLLPWRSAGERPFFLSYHWLDPETRETVVHDGLRTRLPEEVEPGETVLVAARVEAPRGDGTYLLSWDMVHEATTWFSDKGCPTGEVLCEVRGGGGRPGAERPRKAPPAVGRLELWSTAWEMFKSRPLTGVGPDNFRLLYGRYLGRENWDRRIHANNMYLEISATLGLFGLAAFLWLIFRVLRLQVTFFRGCPDRLPSSLMLALCGSTTAFLIHGLFDYFLEFTSIYLFFWLILGLSVSTLRIYRTDV